MAIDSISFNSIVLPVIQNLMTALDKTMKYASKYNQSAVDLNQSEKDCNSGILGYKLRGSNIETGIMMQALFDYSKAQQSHNDLCRNIDNQLYRIIIEFKQLVRLSEIHKFGMDSVATLIFGKLYDCFAKFRPRYCSPCALAELIDLQYLLENSEVNKREIIKHSVNRLINALEQ